MNKTTIWVLMFFLLAIPIFAAQVTVQTNTGNLDIEYPKNPYFLFGEEISAHFHVYNSTGHIVSAPLVTCSLHIYNSTGNHIFENESLNMDSNGIDYAVKLSKDLFDYEGQYSFVVGCNDSLEGGFASGVVTISRTGDITTDAGGFPLAAIIIIPLVLSIIFLVSSAVLGKDHTALKIFFFILSILPTFASLHFGLLVVVKYYNFPALQDAIGNVAYWAGLLFAVIFMYFLIYIIYKIFEFLGNKKKERLQY